jgi:hypothetical protein
VIPEDPDAVKIFAFIARRRDISAGEYHALWRHPHGTLASDIDTFLQYIQAHRLDGVDLPGLGSPHDGAAEMWFRRLDDALGLGANEYYANVVIPDEVRFMDLGPRCFRLITRQQVTKPVTEDPLRRGIKILHCVHRRAGLSVAEFRESVKPERELELSDALGSTGHVLSWSVDETYGDVFVPFDGKAHQWLNPDPYDLVREMWWPNLHELRAALRNAPMAWRELLGADFIDPDLSHGFVADENVVVKAAPGLKP